MHCIGYGIENGFVRRLAIEDLSVHYHLMLISRCPDRFKVIASRN